MATATQQQPTRTLTTRKGRSVETPLTDAEAAAICREMPGDFPRDLARQAASRRGLSADQVTWTHILACEELDRRRREAAAADEPALTLAGIADLFARARAGRVGARGGRHAGLKSPEVHLPLPGTDPREVRLFAYIPTHTRFPGWIGVALEGAPEGTTGLYARAPMVGRIDPEGTFHPGPGAEDAAVATLMAFSDDPAGFAARCGRLSGRCILCRQALTDARSLAMGWGPICAKRWGLEHGKERETLATVALEVAGS